MPPGQNEKHNIVWHRFVPLITGGPQERPRSAHMTEEFIDVYGNYAIKLLRLQNDLAIGVEATPERIKL